MSYINAYNQAIHQLGASFSIALRSLLETKHLYQNVTVDPIPIAERFYQSVTTAEKTAFVGSGQGFGKLTFVALMASDPVATSPNAYAQLQLRLGNVELFCDKCDARKVFAPVWHAAAPTRLADPPLQITTIGYQCQLCHENPHVFIVRRLGWKLTLEGRSPFEEVEIEKFIPKQERSFFRDALISEHAAKPLAALFYLRTFVEQFGRRQTGVTGRVAGDDMLKMYSQNLPAAHRDSMPSLAEWYGRLSEAIHEANADAALFKSALAAVRNHMDIRRVFAIPDGPPKSDRSNPEEDAAP